MYAVRIEFAQQSSRFIESATLSWDFLLTRLMCRDSSLQAKLCCKQAGRQKTRRSCTALYGAETWTLRKSDQKYLEVWEKWCWRRMEKISWTDHVRNEGVLQRVEEDRNILHTIKEGRLTGLVAPCVRTAF